MAYTPTAPRLTPRLFLASVSLVALSACSGDFDFDLRDNFGRGNTNSSAVRQDTAPRPEPDNRGVISYPNYQVAVARRGDTVTDVANRVGLPVDEIARHNGLDANATLNNDAIVLLPRRVAEPSAATGSETAGPILPPGTIDVESLASSAIDRAPSSDVSDEPRQTGLEPIRHRVERGETAYSVARLYNVSVNALAEWNGLSSSFAIREGQTLLIPVVQSDTTQPPAASVTVPGEGTPTPTPPSAVTPLPDETIPTATEVEEAAPESPNLSETRSSSAQFAFPVDGNIIRPFESGSNGGIDIAASAGSSVVAADGGTVAAITSNTDDVPVLVLRHSGGLLTVYANIDDISVARGDSVSRGQQIATVRAGSPAFIRFEVRRGFDSVDPMDFLN
ncbi:LysM peptidoglycan-binding domain-containing protein [Cochlodiniinecator piscidefendens]|uniref:LysM peptidoglycan-binding domain-containing protein n=1 Tax=Cochlodiniinecator piscidefendens TaxID=2715756 RepID=UPI001E643642|nr:LysM peptidoglycan-binding domain-containing protein [Cochlodiniinecator piscidefendens]